MNKPKVDLPDAVKTMFLIKLSGKLHAHKPLIASITSIKIEKIAKMRNGKRFDYRATIEAVGRTGAVLKYKLEHQEECIWVYVS